MINYRKGKNVEEEMKREEIPIPNLPEQFLWMHVKGGTKVSNVVDFANNALNTNQHICVVWSGSGGGVGKTISCAEILKRQIPELQQVTRLGYQKVQEFWEPQLDGLDQIVANRQIPCVHIMQTLDVTDTNTLGYQMDKTTFWIDQAENTNTKSPRPNTSRASGSNGSHSNHKSKNSARKANDKNKVKSS